MPEREGQRRLAAIVAMDIVGYSRMMGVDEDGTLAHVKAVRADLIQPAMTAFHGRLVKSLGDGFLLEFSSVVDAFRFAARVQERSVARNAGLSPDKALLFRIGLNIGDVIVEDGDVFGDGVNIAARLEQMADPGGICLSDRAWRDLRNLDVAFEDLGPRQLKNIADPIRVYRTTPPSDGIAQPVKAASFAGFGKVRSSSFGRPMTLAAIGAVLALVAAAGVYWWLRQHAPVTHGMTVRLAGFKLLSSDLPATLRDTVNAEIAAAFNADGVVGVATGAASTPGTAPAYSLGGSIQRDGPMIRVITNLTSERSGATIWGNTFDYDGREASKVPRHIAVDAGNVVRCGLFGASTYPKPLPDSVMRDYMQFCEGHWSPIAGEGRKALVPAQRVVAAVPDFSWGWAAVAGGYWKVAGSALNKHAADEARASGRAAADRAVAIDGNNTEALYIKAMLVERNDWLTRATLFKRAVTARRLDCGCEYHQYGWMLLHVGRVAEAVERLHQANNMLALYIFTPLNLADALLAAGKPEEAKSVTDAAIELSPNATFAERFRAYKAMDFGDAEALRSPKWPLSEQLRLAVLDGLAAVQSGEPAMKRSAIRSLNSLPEDQQNLAVARLLVELGAVHDALRVAARLAAKPYPGPSVFWHQSMRAILNDPGFPAVAAGVGLMTYWKSSKLKPDVCGESAPPSFCRMI